MATIRAVATNDASTLLCVFLFTVQVLKNTQER